MARITGIALAAAVALGLAACGGASGQHTGTTVAAPSQASRALAVARQYAAASVDGDYAQVCALLTPAARASYVAAAQATGDGTCAGVLKSIGGAVAADAQDGTQGVRVTLVSLTGERARVRTTVEQQSDTLTLVRSGGRWRVDAGL